MKLMFTILLINLFLACSGSDDPQDEPILPEPPKYETTITVENLPDSIKVETSVDVKFTVAQQDHPEDFKIEVDAVVASYFLQMGYSDNGKQIFSDKISGKVSLSVNGESLSNLSTIRAEKENTLSFSNPTAVGKYVIKLLITDKYDRKAVKEIEMKVYSPEITIRFFSKNIGFDEENYFADLNGKYTFSPLSEELKGKRVDTIYTQEMPKHGEPGSWTVPGQSLICYIGQEGGYDMQFFTAQSSFVRMGNKPLTNTDFASRVDGIAYWGLNDVCQQGFHGVMFETSTLTTVGSYYYTIRVVDKWGKEKMETISYKAFGRNETIPSHCTPSPEINFWWAHYIKD